MRSVTSVFEVLPCGRLMPWSESDDDDDDDDDDDGNGTAGKNAERFPPCVGPQPSYLPTLFGGWCLSFVFWLIQHSCRPRKPRYPRGHSVLATVCLFLAGGDVCLTLGRSGS